MKEILIITSIFALYGCSDVQIQENPTPLSGAIIEQEKSIETKNVETSINRVLSNKQKLQKYGLKTNTSKISIDFDKILNGGPGKDGIPAINNPKFVSIEEVNDNMKYITEDSRGISVSINGETKFYPYPIIVWHEIVNDIVGGKEVAITFCPLCGSAIVYDRNINGEIVNFGVSGLLYESNLLMYDNLTESLWSQSIGKAVVGEKIGTKLEYIKSDLMTFNEFKNKYPNGKVLSDDTGFIRDYGNIPYGNYDENDALYFPVTNDDTRLPKKEILYIVNNREQNQSLAFLFKDLREAKKANIKIGNDEYIATFDDGIVDVTINGKIIEGYYEMWFSWINHNENSKNIWRK